MISRVFLQSPLLANSAALMALRAGNLIARLLLLITIARHVSPAAFGLVVFAVSVAEIAKVVSDFGIDTLAIREFAAERESRANDSFAAVLAAAKLSFGIVVYAALAGWFLLTRSHEQAVLGIIVGATMMTALLANFSIDYFTARLRMARVLPAVFGTNIAITLLAIAALPHVPDIRVQVAVFPAIELATGAVLLLLLRRERTLEIGRLAFAGVPGLIRRSLSIAVTSIVIMIYSRLDIMVLASSLDPGALGYYGIAFRISEPFQIAAAAFGLSVFSRFSSDFRGSGSSSLEHTAFRYIIGTLGYGVVAALGLGLLAPPLIERMLPGYVPAIPILRVLSAALVFRTLNATLAGIIQGAGRFRLLTGIAVWNLVFVFVLLDMFVSRFHAQGAAFALLVAEAVNSVIQIVVVARVLAKRRETAADVA